jgi:hypothetical protein
MRRTQLGRAVAATWAAAVLWLPSLRADAQVNTEVLRKRIKDKGASFILEGTFDGRTGNTFGVTADGLIGGGFAVGSHRAFSFASVDYARLNGTLGVDKAFAHVRYDYQVWSNTWWEAFVQAQSDSFQLLKIRDLVGSGPRLAAYQDKQVGIFVGVAYMLERDIYDPPAAPEQATAVYSRVSTYLSASTALSDGIQAVTTTYFQPRVELLRDIRVESESGFVFKLTKVLATSITLSAHYDSNPLPGVLRTDTELKNTLTLAL